MTEKQTQAVNAAMLIPTLTMAHMLKTIHQPDWEFSENRRGWFTSMVLTSEDEDSFGKCMQKIISNVSGQLGDDIMHSILAIEEPSV